MLGLFFNFSIWLVAVIIGGFVFWRRLEREMEEEIFWPLLYKNILSVMLMGRLFWYLRAIVFDQAKLNWLWKVYEYPGFDILGGVIGGILVVNFSNSLRKSIISELGDAWIEAYGWGVGLVLVGHWGLLSSVREWWLPVMVMSGIWFWYLVKWRYRRWLWYKSGKVGFLWWFGLMLLILGLMISLNLREGFEGMGYINSVLFILLLTSIIGLYKLSKRDWRQDFKYIFQPLIILGINIKRRINST